MNRVSTVILVSVLGCAAFGCADSALNCPPGLQIACACADTTQKGIQVCDDDGMRYGTCTGCPDDDVCAPGEFQVCPCPGGGTGVQECQSSGTSWGPCEGCGGSTDGDADGDADSDADADCEYTECEGDTCVDPEDCCAGAGCGSWYYSSTKYVENYCYPMCDTSADDEPCKCGDVCVDLNGMPVCLGTGRLQLNGFTSPAWEDSDAAEPVDPGAVDISAVHDGETLDLSYFEMYWYEYADGSRELDFWAQGQAGDSSAWVLGLYIPEEVFAQGEGEYPLFNEATNSYNFFLEVYLGEYDDDGYFTDVWRENILNFDEAVLTIEQTCDSCAAGSSDCEPCEISADISWFAMRSKV